MQLTDTITLNAEAISLRRSKLVRGTILAVAILGIVIAFPMQAYLSIVLPLMLPTMMFETGGSHPIYWLWGILSTMVVIVAMYLLLIAFSSRKAVVLYLRRFRLEAVSLAMSDAIESGIGRHYRIMTLDDSNFVPLEVPPMERWISRYGSLVTILGALAVTFAVVWLSASIFDRYGLSLGGTGMVGVFMLGGLLTFVLPTVGPMLEYWVLFLVPAFLIQRWRVKKRSQLEISTPEDLSACMDYCQTLSGRIRSPAFMAPQATVVKVVDALWQDTVVGIAERSDAIIIDVSVPTVHVLWEIETAIQGFRPKIIYLGQKALTEQWMFKPTDEKDSEASTKIRTLLEGATVLSYEPISRASKRKFRNNLRNALENLDITPPQHFDVPASWRGIQCNGRTLLPPFFKALAVYLILGIVCIPINFVLWSVVWKYILAAFA